MKIIILGPAFPYRGGIANYNEQLARQFQREGHQVCLITFTLQYPSFLFPGKTQYSEDAKPENLDVSRLMNSCNPINWLRTGRKLAKMDADVAVVSFWLPFMAPCLGTISRLIRRNGRTKVVAALHNMIPHEKRIGDELFARYFVGSVDGFVALSKSVLEDTRRFDDRKPKLFSPHPLYDNFGAPIPRDEAVSRLSLDAQTRYLLFFGLIRDYKGLDLMLRAYADPRIDRTKVRLIVAGEFYSDGEKYHALARDLGIDTDVVWHTNFVPESKVKEYFCAADVIVQPYKTATQSGVTQIAYHFEKPMIVTRVGGLPEIVPHGKVGFVCDPDPVSIADSLHQFFSHPDRDAFLRGLQEEKRKYAWSETTRAVLSVAGL